MKRRTIRKVAISLIAVFSVSFLVLLGVISYVVYTPKDLLMSGVLESVTAEKLRSIEIGYDLDQVEAILGKPIRRVDTPDHPLNLTNPTYLYYSKPIDAFTQPRVQIVFFDGRVDGVEVEKIVLWGEEFWDYYYYHSEDQTIESDDFDKLFK